MSTLWFIFLCCMFLIAFACFICALEAKEREVKKYMRMAEEYKSNWEHEEVIRRILQDELDELQMERKTLSINFEIKTIHDFHVSLRRLLEALKDVQGGHYCKELLATLGEHEDVEGAYGVFYDIKVTF